MHKHPCVTTFDEALREGWVDHNTLIRRVYKANRSSVDGCLPCDFCSVALEKDFWVFILADRTERNEAFLCADCYPKVGLRGGHTSFFATTMRLKEVYPYKPCVGLMQARGTA